MDSERVYERPGRGWEYVMGYLAMGVEWFVAHDGTFTSPPLATKEAAIHWLFV